MINLPALVDAQQMLEGSWHKECLIIDLGSYGRYKKAHVPYAIFFDVKALIRGEGPLPTAPPCLDVFLKALSDIGCTKDRSIIAYDDEGGRSVGRLFWLLDLLGFSKLSYLNGGFFAWYQQGLPLEKQIRTPKSSLCVGSWVNNQVNVDTQFVLSHLENPNYHFLDVRSEEEYLGQKKMAAYSGHIPGAIHCDWTTFLDMNNFYCLRQDLEAYVKSKQIDDKKTWVIYCQANFRSAWVYWILKRVLGFAEVKTYVQGWAEWGNLAHTPKAT